MEKIESMDKILASDPETRSEDIVADNLDRLKDLFPNAFIEEKVDFDVLRQLLGDTVEDRKEKYGLNWHGKRSARQLALTPSTVTLRPCPEESVDWDTTQNLMIEGDNLEVLKLLQKSYSGKVKLIYIDPPYNNGKDFVYPDDYRNSLRNYLSLTGQIGKDARRITSLNEVSGRFHTHWMNMIMPRLLLARTLLKRDGTIFISIDDTKVANVRLILDDIFGSENFISELIWEGANKNDAQQIGICHEYVLVYARHRESVQRGWHLEKEGVEAVLREIRRLKALHGNNYRAASDDLAGWFRANKSKPAFQNRRFRNIDRAWDPKPEDMEDALLSSVNHIEKGRTTNDILYELLLKLGLDLSVPIETKTMANKSVHSVGAGALFVCLDDEISRDDVEQLAVGISGWHGALSPAGESTVVFLDSAFTDDVVKTNLAETLKQADLSNVRSL